MENERNIIEIPSFLAGDKIRQKREEEARKEYIENKKKQLKQQKINQRNKKVKKIAVRSFAAGMIAASVMTVTGMKLHVGTRLIYNNVAESGVDYKNVNSQSTLYGLQFLEKNLDGTINVIDTDSYLKELELRGQEAGFSIDEISVYCNYKYGTSHVFEGTTLIGRAEEKLNAYENFIKGYDISMNEGRSK